MLERLPVFGTEVGVILSCFFNGRRVDAVLIEHGLQRAQSFLRQGFVAVEAVEMLRECRRVFSAQQEILPFLNLFLEVNLSRARKVYGLADEVAAVLCLADDGVRVGERPVETPIAADAHQDGEGRHGEKAAD